MPACVAIRVVVGEMEVSINAASPSGSFGESEIENLHCVVRARLHVGRFEIPVHDATLVRVFQSIGDLSGDADGLHHGNRALADAVGERRPFHEFHQQGAHGAGIFQTVDRGNVGMI